MMARFVMGARAFDGGRRFGRHGNQWSTDEARE